MITSYPTKSNGIIVLVNSQIGFLPPIFISTILQSICSIFVRKIFKLGALFSILGKTPTNGSWSELLSQLES